MQHSISTTKNKLKKIGSTLLAIILIIVLRKKIHPEDKKKHLHHRKKVFGTFTEMKNKTTKKFKITHRKKNYFKIMLFLNKSFFLSSLDNQI